MDDEEDLIYLYNRTLAQQGYQVTCFSDSLAALKEFQQQPDSFDIVVTDMTMPNLTGLDLIREILKIRPDIQSILCTGYSKSVNKGKVESVGVCEFLVKPFSPRRLAETIRKVVEHG